jgi:hypothetical protein
MRGVQQHGGPDLHPLLEVVHSDYNGEVVGSVGRRDADGGRRKEGLANWST